MFVFQRSFLSGLYRVTGEDPGSSCAAKSRFHGISSGKFRATICEQDMDIFSKKSCAKDGSEKVNAFLHGLCSLVFVINGEEDAGIYKFEGLVMWYKKS